jgi:chemotaxis signal transduction protein
MVESPDLELTLVNQLDALIFNPLPPETRQPMLRFPFNSQDNALVPLEQITEIFRVESTDILSVPEMPSCVLGICNWRGEMLWLVDFNDFIGCPSSFQQVQAPVSLLVMVIQVDQQSVGIGVSQVSDVELHELQSLQAAVPGLFPAGLLPLIAGVLPGCSDAVLDMKAIARCPLWKNHARESL